MFFDLASEFPKEKYSALLDEYLLRKLSLPVWNYIIRCSDGMYFKFITAFRKVSLERSSGP